MMFRVALSLLLASLAVSSSGCLFWKKKPHAAKPSYQCADLEASFKVRWLEKRTSELTAEGKTAAEAAARAEQEFAQQFAYTKVANPGTH